MPSYESGGYGSGGMGLGFGSSESSYARFGRYGGYMGGLDSDSEIIDAARVKRDAKSLAFVFFGLNLALTILMTLIGWHFLT